MKKVAKVVKKPSKKVAKTSKKAPTKKATKTSPQKPMTQPLLLSGGNPQMAKGDGDAPVQAYLAAIVDWKREVARQVDALVARAVPGVAKAVRWNSPFYGVPGHGWFLSYHCFDKYLKVVFLNGASLKPLPPTPSKVAGTRYLHLKEGEALDEKQLLSWLKQAAKLPGQPLF